MRALYRLSIKLCLHLQPVTNHSLAFGSKNAFWMELYAVDVKRLVTESHNLSLVTLGCYLKAFRQTFLTNHP